MTYSEVAVKFSTLTSPFYVDLGIAKSCGQFGGVSVIAFQSNSLGQIDLKYIDLRPAYLETATQIFLRLHSQ
jgi:hypothetical protein